MTSLTQAEADKFAAYLEQLAQDADRLAKQCDAVDVPAAAKKLRTEAMAATIIAQRLRATEFVTVTVGPDSALTTGNPTAGKRE